MDFKNQRKKLFRYLALAILPIICAQIIRILYLSGKKTFHLPQVVPEEPFIVVFWHGDMLFQPFLYYRLRKKPNIKVIISSHFDGKIIAKIISYLKLDTIHGSSSKNAARVLISAIRALKKGEEVAITPDGPKGPRYEVADGVVVMAQKTNSKLIIFSCQADRYWQFNSWDRFVIPKPFAKLDFYASEPMDISGMDKEEAKKIIKERLMLHSYS